MPNMNCKMLINPRNREEIREDVGVREERRVERGRLYFFFLFCYWTGRIEKIWFGSLHSSQPFLVIYETLFEILFLLAMVAAIIIQKNELF